MAKFKFKEFVLQKGEKIVLGVALAGLGLLAVMGISRFASAENPTAKSEGFKQKADDLTRKMGRTEGDPGVTKLPEWVHSQNDLVAIAPDYFRSPYHAFEAVDKQSDKRDNPAVLGPTEVQIDLVRAPVKAYEVLVTDKGVEIGLLVGVKQGTFDPAKIQGLLRNLGDRARRNQAPPPPPPPAPGTLPPAAPTPTALAPGGGGGRGMRGARDFPGGQDANATRTEKTIRYVSVDDYDKEIQKPDVLPALSVYPIRMIVVNASFPLKEQLEVIRRALRLKSLAEAAQESAPPGGGYGPTFDGFEVERKITDRAGNVYDWASYDHVGEYMKKINIRKYADQPDDGLLMHFMRYDQKMVMPLPALAMNIGVYPGIRIPSIVAGYQKLQNANKKPVDPSEQAKKFTGKGQNIFQPTTAPDGGGGFGGSFNTPSSFEGIRRGAGPPVAINAGTPAAAPGMAALPQELIELEHLLIRFLDVDIRPGFSYQYRLRVKMKNPNHKKTDKVARPADADAEVLTGPWVSAGAVVSVPDDTNVYAGDPIAYAEKVRKDYRDQRVINLMDNKNGELPVLQFQQWRERIPIDAGKSEPAGYWVVAEVPVSRGEFVGRKQILPLPMWSSEKIGYILQDLPKYSVGGSKGEKPKGLLVDLTTEMLVVDYEGGKAKLRLSDRTLDDEADVEIMLLNPDGTVSVKNAGADRADEDRKSRDETWKKWLEEIKKITDAAGMLTQPGIP